MNPSRPSTKLRVLLLGLVVVLTAGWVGFSTMKAKEERMIAAARDPENGPAFKEWVHERLSSMVGLKDLEEADGSSAPLNPNRWEVELRVGERIYPFALDCEWRSSIMGAPGALTNGRNERPSSTLGGRPCPRFVVLGIGGRSNAPEALYIIPMEELPTGRITTDYLERYRQPMSSALFQFDPFGKKLSY